ncbi:MAG: efflux RND transporter periplasmic adaptor subunit [Desulfocapsaceae bacterium]|nr:efflux RND transporter periplasmic adaptor subunit [Desulfocapsaceae bacterium]
MTEQSNTRDRFIGKPIGKKVFFLLSATILLAVFLTSQLYGEKAQQSSSTKNNIRVLTVATEEIVPLQSYTRTRSYLGKVEARRTSNLGFEISGLLIDVYVQEGEQVEKGQLLAELDTDRLLAAKREAEAQLEETEASLRLAGATLRRIDQAQKLKAVSVQELDEAKSNLDSQRARFVRVKAQIERIDVDLKKAKLYAPYSGTLATRMSDEGTVVSAGQPVLEIVETDRVEIRLGIAREFADDLQLGDPLEGRINGDAIPLQISRILPGREALTRVVQIIAEPVEPGINLREADLVEVSLNRRIDVQGYWLPISALTENGRGIWSCFVAEPVVEQTDSVEVTHQLKRRDLQVIFMEDERVFAKGNFQSGDRVVMDGLHRVVPNQRVRLASDQVVEKQSLAWQE